MICFSEIDESKFYNKDIEDYKDHDQINKYFEFNIVESNEFKASESLTFIREKSLPCDKCKFSLKLSLLHYVTKKANDLSIDTYCTEIVPTHDCEIVVSGFLGLGLDIFALIKSLYLRWWVKGFSIDCVMPFIQSDFLKIFLDILKYSTTYKKNLSNHPVKNLKDNPFCRILLRNIQNKTKKIDLSIIISEFEENLTQREISLLNSLLEDSIWIANNPNKIESESERNFKYQDNFHAKFTAGFDSENTELLITSYNFTDYQNLQFDTYYLKEIETESYENQINMLMKYYRLRISKY